MTKSRINRLGRRLALITALTALMAAAGASAASAAVTVTPNAGIAWTGASVSVTGNEIPTGTDSVAIVVCNASATLGTRCDNESATPGFVTKAAYEAGVAINVQRGPWVDFDFSVGTPAEELETETTCFSAKEKAGDACSVVVSFYKTTGGFAQLGAQAAAITFE
jgi:hypothetical protein